MWSTRDVSQVEVSLSGGNTIVDVTAYDGTGCARSVYETVQGQASEVVGFATNDGSALIRGVLISYAGGVTKNLRLAEVKVVASSSAKGCCA